MQQFEIGLKDNRHQRYLNFLLFCILLNVMLFSWLLTATVHSYSIFTGLIFCALLFIVHVSKKWTKLSITPHYYLIVVVLIWMISLEWLPALLNVIFIFSAVYLHKKVKIVVDQAGIIIHAYPKKTFTWKEADNVMIKDGLMTIDLLNNKLFQFPVEYNSLKESEFNAFSKDQISRHKMD